jgi:hypothetical protein
VISTLPTGQSLLLDGGLHQSAPSVANALRALAVPLSLRSSAAQCKR